MGGGINLATETRLTFVAEQKNDFVLNLRIFLLLHLLRSKKKNELQHSLAERGSLGRFIYFSLLYFSLSLTLSVSLSLFADWTEVHTHAHTHLSPSHSVFLFLSHTHAHSNIIFPPHIFLVSPSFCYTYMKSKMFSSPLSLTHAHAAHADSSSLSQARTHTHFLLFALLWSEAKEIKPI